MNDLISRQAAIARIDKLDIPEDMCVFEILSHVELELGTMPTENQWIPCSERLPNVDEEVFVYLFGDSSYIAWHDGVDWCTEDFTVDKDEEPLAWMPLPEPYKGEEL